MKSYAEVITHSFTEYSSYLWNLITFNKIPWFENYFYGLLIISIIVWGLEIVAPWRKKQEKFRKDFWLDAFYMFFNFFIFRLIIFNAMSETSVHFFEETIGINVESVAIIDIQTMPHWAQILVFFLALDFIQWFTHVMLHKFNFLWKFHQVHHSVKEMGFAAHLRYHWMENVFYTPMKYIALVLIGNFHPEDAYVVYFFTIIIGHLNHANINLSYGPLKYLFNNPKMHIWHHAKQLPKERALGVNFGISLSIWDYIFKKNYIPHDGRDIELGFDNLEKFPKTFTTQSLWPWLK